VQCIFVYFRRMRKVSWMKMRMLSRTGRNTMMRRSTRTRIGVHRADCGESGDGGDGGDTSGVSDYSEKGGGEGDDEEDQEDEGVEEVDDGEERRRGER
jgi:hypothetical protein